MFNMNMYGGVRTYLHSVLNLGSSWKCGQLHVPANLPSATWVGPRASLDASEKGKLSWPFWESADISVVRAAAFESFGRFVAVAQPRSLGPFYITSYIKAYLGSKQLSCAVEQNSRNVRVCI